MARACLKRVDLGSPPPRLDGKRFITIPRRQYEGRLTDPAWNYTLSSPSHYQFWSEWDAYRTSGIFVIDEGDPYNLPSQARTLQPTQFLSAIDASYDVDVTLNFDITFDNAPYVPGYTSFWVGYALVLYHQNGTHETVGEVREPLLNGSTTHTLSMNCSVEMEVGDYMKFQPYQSSGGTELTLDPSASPATVHRGTNSELTISSHDSGIVTAESIHFEGDFCIDDNDKCYFLEDVRERMYQTPYPQYGYKHLYYQIGMADFPEMTNRQTASNPLDVGLSIEAGLATLAVDPVTSTMYIGSRVVPYPENPAVFGLLKTRVGFAPEIITTGRIFTALDWNPGDDSLYGVSQPVGNATVEVVRVTPNGGVTVIASTPTSGVFVDRVLGPFVPMTDGGVISPLITYGGALYGLWHYVDGVATSHYYDFIDPYLLLPMRSRRLFAHMGASLTAPANLNVVNPDWSLRSGCTNVVGLSSTLRAQTIFTSNLKFVAMAHNVGYAYPGLGMALELWVVTDDVPLRLRQRDDNLAQSISRVAIQGTRNEPSSKQRSIRQGTRNTYT